MPEIGNLIVYITAIDQTARAFRSVQDNLSATERLTRALGTAFTAVFAYRAIVQPIRQAVDSFIDLQRSMTEVAAVTGATGVQFERLYERAKEVGRETIFSAQEAAKAMYYLASAGLSVNDIMKVSDETLKLAAVTQSDLAQTSEILVTILKAYGMRAEEASRISNVLAAASTTSQAKMDRLGQSLRDVVPITASLGWSLEETVAVLSKLYDAGLKSSVVGTGLRTVIKTLLDPTKNAIEVLDSFGISLDSVNPKLHSMAEIIQALAPLTGHEAELLELFGTRGGPVMMSLLSIGSQALMEYTQSITGTNKATEMYNTLQDSAWGATMKLQNAVEELKISFAEALAPALLPLIQDFTDLLSTIQPLIVGLGTFGSMVLQTARIVALSAAVIYYDLKMIWDAMTLNLQGAREDFGKLQDASGKLMTAYWNLGATMTGESSEVKASWDSATNSMIFQYKNLNSAIQQTSSSISNLAQRTSISALEMMNSSEQMADSFNEATSSMIDSLSQFDRKKDETVANIKKASSIISSSTVSSAAKAVELYQAGLISPGPGGVLYSGAGPEAGRYYTVGGYMVDTKTGQVVGRMQRGGIITKPIFTLAGEAGPEAIIPLERFPEIGTKIINITQNITVRTERQAEILRLDPRELIA